MSTFSMGASRSVCKIYVIDPALREAYAKRIAEHNKKLEECKHPDSGFDILQPSEVILCNEQALANKLKLGVMAAAYDIESSKPLAYYLFPRSSISKTPMRMSNSVGIIDSGYRGELMAMVDLEMGRGTGAQASAGQASAEEFRIQVHDRYFQLCMGDLSPFYVEMVEKLEDLGITERGAGGFGSTGL